MDAALTAKKVLRALDPNDDPSAEPVSPLALVALAVAIGVSVTMFLRWKIQPTQDFGHHLAFTAVFADYGKPGSIYPAIYKPLDWLNTNSLLYTVAGGLGKVWSTSWMFRLTMATYFAGVPLANLYALRVFGRSAWGALISVPLCWNQMYVYGFANFLFAAPLAVLAIPLFYRLLVAPSVRRGIGVAVLLAALFLAHLHVFLWTGVLLATMTLAGVFITTKRTLFGMTSTKPWTIVWVSSAVVLPALALFARWAIKTSRPPPADEYTLATVGKATLPGFLKAIRPFSQSIGEFHYTLLVTKHEFEWRFYAGLFFVGLVCVAVSRMHKWKRPPVMELAAAATMASYFVLPQDFVGQQVIATRQVSIGLWLAAALFAPVPLRVTWLGRLFAIVGLTSLTSFHFAYWGNLMRKFQKEEIAGLEEVLAAAPPRLKLHYVKIDPDSKYFATHTFWHLEKWYMLDKGGQVDESPATGASQAVRFRSTYPLHRIEEHANNWPSVMEIWQNFDLVLIHRWKPTAKDLELANTYGERIAQQGDWDLWRSKLKQ